MKSQNKKLQISCDGGAATGKSTGAKMLSKKYKLSREYLFLVLTTYLIPISILANFNSINRSIKVYFILVFMVKHIIRRMKQKNLIHIILIY